MRHRLGFAVDEQQRARNATRRYLKRQTQNRCRNARAWVTANTPLGTAVWVHRAPEQILLDTLRR